MESWLIYAIISMLFTGVTAILIKYGLDGVSAEVGMLVRTAIMFAMVVGGLLVVAGMVVLAWK